MMEERNVIERLVILRPQSPPCKRGNICDESRPSISSVMTISLINSAVRSRKGRPGKKKEEIRRIDGRLN